MALPSPRDQKKESEMERWLCRRGLCACVCMHSKPCCTLPTVPTHIPAVGSRRSRTSQRDAVALDLPPPPLARLPDRSAKPSYRRNLKHHSTRSSSQGRRGATTTSRPFLRTVVFCTLFPFFYYALRTECHDAVLIRRRHDPSVLDSAAKGMNQDVHTYAERDRHAGLL